ncbi:MAG TPA: hypothetical protein PKC45_06105 [Gemmatales bacterium]|nr:hypothetical protein [Gemmatales bacterium]
MKRMVFASLLALVAGGFLASSAQAGDCKGPFCGDVYRPCISVPMLRVPVFAPRFKVYCECSAPYGQPWWSAFPQQANTGYSIAPYGAFQGAVQGGGTFAQPAGQIGYYGGGAQVMAPPSYWYGR